MVVLMIPAIVASLFGHKLLSHYLFPLLYLLFAVPFGEFLIPRLQEITAHMTIAGLKLTGIPVYTEGLFISIPAGDFEVAKACSGIRYLIASVALGTLYAYLTYTKWYKQFIFVAACVIAPIFANGLRAYGILLIAHLSDLKYATGVDHLIYGWLFFGLVMLVLFYLGGLWQDDAKTETAVIDESTPDVSMEPGKSYLSIAIILMMGPVLNTWMSYQPENLIISEQQVPDVNVPWIHINDKPRNWIPSFKNADIEITAVYKNNHKEVFYYSAFYQFESQNKELVNSANEIFNKKNWILINRQSEKITVNDADFPITEYNVRNNNEKLLIWGWYNVFGSILTHPVKIKIMQSLGKLTGTGRGGRFVAIATVYKDDKAKAAKQLEAFLSSTPQIIRSESKK